LVEAPPEGLATDPDGLLPGMLGADAEALGRRVASALSAALKAAHRHVRALGHLAEFVAANRGITKEGLAAGVRTGRLGLDSLRRWGLGGRAGRSSLLLSGKPDLALHFCAWLALRHACSGKYWGLVAHAFPIQFSAGVQRTAQGDPGAGPCGVSLTFICSGASGGKAGVWQDCIKLQCCRMLHVSTLPSSGTRLLHPCF
jgi:hypothetical protein